MSAILNTAISGINAMRVIMQNTVNKINYNNNENLEKRVFLENISEENNTNTAVQVKEIYDNYNDFIEEEKRKTSAQVENEKTSIEQLLKLEDIFSKKYNVFNQLVDELYQQIEKDIILNRQNTINKDIQAKLTNIMISLKDFNNKLKSLEQNIKELIMYNIKKVNSLIDQIHDININIRYFPTVELPNRVESLIDKRDRLVDELNNLIGVKVVKNNENYKVYLCNGLCIINNNQKQNLIPLTSVEDNAYISIGYIDNTDTEIKQIDDTVPIGVLGALLRFRREDLNNAKNKVGQLTVNFADSINEYHSLGHDMFGNLGKKVFHISNPENISSAANRSSPIMSSRWIETNHAKDTDYIICFSNNTWNITRISDCTMVQPKISEEKNSLVLTFDGIELSIRGNSYDGDTYMIKPYSKTLEELELLVQENDPFAFSSIDENNSQNRNNAIMMHKFNQDLLVNQSETLSQSYHNFCKSISSKCNALEEEVPFKANMVKILSNKKIPTEDIIEKDYQELNYQQDCYLANVKVLQTAENILNEIIDCYS